MSLSTNTYNALVRVATECKSLRTLINGNVGTLAGLTTTDKTNLVNAVNEVAAAIATAAGIDDSGTSTSSSWSSSKTSAEIAAALDALLDDGTASAGTVWSSTKTNSEIGSQLAALINDAATATTTTWSSSAITAEIGERIDALINGAPGTADTLAELNNLITTNADAVTAINTALANRVRWDAAQSLTAPQQAQARTNIGAAAASDLGDPNTDLVAAFTAALV